MEDLSITNTIVGENHAGNLVPNRGIFEGWGGGSGLTSRLNLHLFGKRFKGGVEQDLPRLYLADLALVQVALCFQSISSYLMNIIQ